MSVLVVGCSGNNHMKQIPLSGGTAFALVDDEDFEFLSRFKWIIDKKGYAMAGIRMHRMIMNAPDGLEVDHRNGERADNQKANLRLCTPAHNSQNKKVYAGSRHGYKGAVVSSRGYIQARVTFNNKSHHIGTFRTAHQAALAYDLWATYFFGEFAMTNHSVVLNGP